MSFLTLNAHLIEVLLTEDYRDTLYPHNTNYPSNLFLLTIPYMNHEKNLIFNF